MPCLLYPNDLPVDGIKNKLLFIGLYSDKKELYAPDRQMGKMEKYASYDSIAAYP